MQPKVCHTFNSLLPCLSRGFMTNDIIPLISQERARGGICWPRNPRTTGQDCEADVFADNRDSRTLHLVTWPRGMWHVADLPGFIHHFTRC